MLRLPDLFRPSAFLPEVSDAEVTQAIRLIPQHYAVGPTVGADGTTPATVRYGKTGEQTVQQAHGKYYEAASRGALFSATDAGAGIAVPTSISTTSVLSLYNPPGSGKRLVIKKVACAYLSGTMAATSNLIFHCENATPSQTAPSSGTLVTAVCLDVGNGASPVGVVRSASTVVAPSALWPLLWMGAAFAGGTTASAPPGVTIEDVDGAIVVEPGCSYQIQGVLTGGSSSSPKITVGVVWEEVTIV